jgi:hypothetical protein
MPNHPRRNKEPKMMTMARVPRGGPKSPSFGSGKFEEPDALPVEDMSGESENARML